MNSTSKQLLRCTLFAGVIAGLTGCMITNIQLTSPEPAAGTQEPRGDRTVETLSEDLWPLPGSYGEVIDTAGNSGLLNVHINSFYSGNGGQACFLTGNGWDRYFPLPRYFLGPGVTPDALSYTNFGDFPNVTVRTCDPVNGTALETGIVIYEQYHPSTDKKCATNSPACLASAKLTINQRSIAAGKKYRAVVFYKTATLDSLTNVQIRWSYP